MFAPFLFFFADQRCENCRREYHLDWLTPLVAPNGNLIGFRCLEGCMP
jgi:hypothetical protein